MNCENVRENLSLYIDGQSDDALVQDIAGHLEVCAECRDEFMQLKQNAEILASLPSIPIPKGFDERLRAALISESKWMKKNYSPGYLSGSNSKKRMKINWQRSGSIAAVFVFLVAGAGLYQQGFFDWIIKDSNKEAQLKEAQTGDDMSGQDALMQGSSLSDADEGGLTEGETSDSGQSSEKRQADDGQQVAMASAGGGISEDSATAESQSDRGAGVMSQRQMPENVTDEALQVQTAYDSPNMPLARQQAEDSCAKALDPGYSECTLVSYANTPEAGEVFTFRAQGYRNYSPCVYEVRVQIGLQGMSVNGSFNEDGQSEGGSSQDE